MRKRILVCLMIAVVATAFMPVNTFAAPKTVKMKAYTVYKKGNTVYCAGGTGIYKVKVKKGKVKSKKRLAKLHGALFTNVLKKKGKYLYFFDYTGLVEGAYLKRVKIRGGKVKTLVFLNEATDFVIKGKRIYYADYETDDGTFKVMKLNGKGKKKTNTIPNTIYKTSNKKGYKLITKEVGRCTVDYLKTPKGTYYLGKVKWKDE